MLELRVRFFFFARDCSELGFVTKAIASFGSVFLGYTFLGLGSQGTQGSPLFTGRQTHLVTNIFGCCLMSPFRVPHVPERKKRKKENTEHP